MGRDVFMRSILHQDVVSFSYLFIGEAIKRIDDELTASHPYIPWRQYARFRDVLNDTEIIVAWQASQDESPRWKMAN